MCPPRPIRGRAQNASHNLLITYILQYELLETTPISGNFKLQFPSFFPTKIHPPKLPITEISETKTVTIQLNHDDQTVESMLRNPFIHIVRFPYEPPPPVLQPNSKVHRPPKRTVETFLPEYLQLDTKPLLLPNHLEISASCVPSGYKSFSLTIRVDKPIVDINFLRKFTPIFVHLKSIDNMPDVPYPQADLEKKFAPVFYKICFNNEEYFIRPQPHSNRLVIDTVISILPRTQSDIYFEVHDRDSTLPSMNNALGTGMICPYEKSTDLSLNGLYLDADALISPHLQTKTSLGFCTFRSLPGRKAHVGIRPSKEACVVSPGNFFECQTELFAEIIDPTEKFENELILQQQQEKQAHPQPTKLSQQKQITIMNAKGVPNISPKGKLGRLPLASSKKGQNLQPVEEDNTSRYHRWIFICSVLNEMAFRKVSSAIEDYHCQVLEEANKSVLKTYNFSKAINKTTDLITGFALHTPDEFMIIVESRADFPNEASKMLEDIFNRHLFPANSVSLIDTNIKFPYPRIYKTFDCLVKDIHLPFPIHNLLRLEGLYFHKSINSVLFPVVQKLYNLLTCESLKTCEECDFFPTETEILQLYSKSEMLNSQPFQNKQSLLEKPKSKFFMSIGDPELSTSTIQIPEVKENIESSQVLRFRRRTSIFDIESFQSHQRNISPAISNAFTNDSMINGNISSFYSSKNSTRKNKDYNSKPLFEPFGNKKEVTPQTPRKRIACSDNGDVEIWAVDDVKEAYEDGWEVEIIRKPDKSIYRSPSTCRHLKSNHTSMAKSSPRKKRSSVRRAQTTLKDRKPFQC